MGINKSSVDRRIRRAIPRPWYDLAKNVYHSGREAVHLNPGRGHLLPDFLIIGSTKCGTTSLHGWLMQHPFVAETKKEIHFFNIHFYYGVDWYRTYFPKQVDRNAFAKQHGQPFLSGEATASYMLHQHAPARAAKVVPDAKLVVILRNPVDRAYSQFHYFKRRGQETLDTFEQGLAAEDERLAGQLEHEAENEHWHSWPLHWASYKLTSCYADQLDRWFAVYPRDQFLFLSFEDQLVADPKGTLELVYDHIGIPSHDIGDFPTLNSGDYEPIAADTRKQLEEYFAPHNERLYELIGRDFGWSQ